MADFSLNVKINGAEQAVQTVAQIEQALAATKNELKNVQIGSQAFDDLSKQAVTLQRELVNSYKETTNFNKNIAELGQSVGSLASTVTAGFTIATSAITLFGGESEDLTKAQVKAQQALALALSATTIATNAKTLVEDLNNVASALGLNLTRQKTTATAVSTVATEAQAVATTEAAVAQTGLNAAMAANPIGLVLVALTALVGALVLFSGEEETAKTKIEDTTKALLDQAAQQKKNTDDFEKVFRARRKIYEDEAKTEEERAKRRQETEDELKQITKDSNDSQEKIIKEANAAALNEANKYSQAFIGTRRELVREVAQFDEFGVFIGYAQEYQDVSYKIGEDTLNALRDNWKQRQATINQGVKDERITQDEANVLLRQAETEYYTQLLVKQSEFFSQSDKASDENFKNNLAQTLSSLKSSREAYEGYYFEIYQAQLEAAQKQKEEEEKLRKEREAEAKRQAEIAKQARQKLNDDLKQTLEELNKIEAKSIDDLRKLQLERNEVLNIDLRKVSNGRIEIAKQELRGKEGILRLEYSANLENLQKIYDEQLKAVNDSKVITEKQKVVKRESLKTELNEAIANSEALFQERVKLAQKEDQFAVIDRDRKLQKLRQENAILQNEIAVGDQNVLDAKADFENKRIEVEVMAREFIRGLNSEGYNNLLQTLSDEERAYLNSLDVKRSDQATSYAQAVADEIAFQAKINELRAKQRKNEFDAAVNAAEAEKVRAIDGAVSLLEQELGVRIKAEESYIDEATGRTMTRYKVIGDISAEEEKILQERLALIQQNETTKSESEVLQIKANYRKQEFDAATADAQKLAEARDKILVKTATDFTAVLQNLASTTNNAYASIAASLGKAFTDFVNLGNQTFTTTTEKVAAYANAIAGALTGIVNGLSQAFSQFYAQQIENTQITANTQKDIQTTQYNEDLAALQAKLQQGLITEQQFKDAQFDLNQGYQNSVKAIEDKRLKEELAIKKKAFDADKALKITQAVIAGAQGAVQAFASAMVIPPPAGPIIGATLAGVIAALTAAQIAIISKQQFNPGQTVTQAQVNLPGGGGGGNLGGTAQVNQASSGGFTGFQPGLMGAQFGTPGAPSQPGGQSGPMKVYVVESDITDSQNRVRTLESNATFG